MSGWKITCNKCGYQTERWSELKLADAQMEEHMKRHETGELRTMTDTEFRAELAKAWEEGWCADVDGVTRLDNPYLREKS